MNAYFFKRQQLPQTKKKNFYFKNIYNENFPVQGSFYGSYTLLSPVFSPAQLFLLVLSLGNLFKDSYFLFQDQLY